MPIFRESAQLLCIGLNHHSATIGQREVLSKLVNDEGTTSLLDIPSISECVVLSTCNRVEWYLVAHDGLDIIRFLVTKRIADSTGLDEDEIRSSLTVLEGTAAIRQLFAVASGLDSMVIGESEILGQVSRAYTNAVEEHSTGPVLDALLRAAIRCGKRVRSETAIGANPASVSSVALDLAASRLGDLEHQNILVIGVGRIGSLVCKLLRAQGVQHVVLMNRTLERAEAMAQSDWSVRPMEELASALASADCVISATSAQEAIISATTIAQARALRARDSAESRERTPWLFLDLALPRDIAPEVETDGELTVFDLDHMKESMQRAVKKRESALPPAYAIVNEEVLAFEAKLRELEVRPLVVELRLKAEEIRRQELARTLRFLGEVEPDTVVHLQHLTRALVNKLLHAPTVRMKEMAVEDCGDEVLTTICDLFGLDASPSSP